jgi:hypothetical protein
MGPYLQHNSTQPSQLPKGSPEWHTKYTATSCKWAYESGHADTEYQPIKNTGSKDLTYKQVTEATLLENINKTKLPTKMLQNITIVHKTYVHCEQIKLRF